MFVDPNEEVLLQTNTNAGGKLRQVAFDQAVSRQLGSKLFEKVVRQYQEQRGLQPENFSFSELELVQVFGNYKRTYTRYVIDNQRYLVIDDPDNKLKEFVNWAGKTSELPLSYQSVDKSFFKSFLYKNALDTRMDYLSESGLNPRSVERQQLIRIMTMFAEELLLDKWNPEVGSYKIEQRVSDGEDIPSEHLQAWRVCRAEVIANIVSWLALVIRNFFAFTGQNVPPDKLLHTRFPDELWNRIECFYKNIGALPCWFDKKFAMIVFGPKRNLDYWDRVFETGKSPDGIQILTDKLDLKDLIS